ncbi:MAG: sensor domain-containing diguanylate cyclase [Candidatus Omnitrophota bacterium]
MERIRSVLIKVMGSINRNSKRELGYLALLIAATICYFVYFHARKISKLNAALFLPVLWLLPMAIRLGKSIFDSRINAIKKILRETEACKRELSLKLDSENRQRDWLQKKLSRVSKLYTITKEMSFRVRFNELFNLLKDFMEDDFHFEEINVGLFKDDKGSKLVEMAYSIKGDVVIHDSYELHRIPSDLIDIIFESRNSVFLELKEELSGAGFDPALKNVLAIPLIARKKIIALLLVKNTSRDQKDKFLILATQLALQIERIRLFENVERLSITDGLTGTYLRRHFMERFDEEVARTRESGLDLSFIMIDLDQFKKCNDEFGHLVGDVVLKDIADIVKKNIREIDFVARYGGEEFCVLLPEAKKESARNVAERIRKIIEGHTIRAYDESVKMTVSIGVSSFPSDSKDPKSLIENADRALYAAKRKGRNRVCLA